MTTKAPGSVHERSAEDQERPQAEVPPLPGVGKTVSVIGVPFSRGQPRNGAESGVGIVRAGGLLNPITSLGYQVDDCGDLQVDNEKKATDTFQHVKNPRSVGAANKLLCETVSDRSKKGNFCLVIGGDHSIAIGSISGRLAVDPNLCILWIDAHADINTPETSPTGNIHGMPISFFSHVGSSTTLPGFEWLVDDTHTKRFPGFDRLAYIGLRDVDEVEKTILKQHNIKSFSMMEVDRLGIGKVMELALKHINPDGDRPLHVSFDVDALDPTVTPATGTPVPGGLTIREGRYILEAAYATGNFKSLDVVEVNPVIAASAADADLTAHNTIYLIRSALGYTFV